MEVSECTFCLPRSPIPVERLFVWSLDRSRMLESIIQALLFRRLNIEITCPEFYDKIKNNYAFIQKIVSNEEYEWLQVTFMYCRMTSNKHFVFFT
jgi:hypothetical protein